MVYASFQVPPAGDPYNPLQMLIYFGVVFLLEPFMIATGAAMSPAIDSRFPRYPRIFGGRHVSSLVVVDKEGRPLGIVTERDIVRKACVNDVNTSRNKEIMSAKLSTIKPD
jgi:CBS domain-containing protein